MEFNHRGTQWAAQTATAALSYALWFDPVCRRWYLDASWQTSTAELPSLHQLWGLHTLAVDLNADHLAAWVITGDGNPIGDPVTIAYDSSGGAGRNNASLRHAITRLLRIAVAVNCAAARAGGGVAARLADPLRRQGRLAPRLGAGGFQNDRRRARP